MVNPAYRLLLGMVVLLTGLGYRSAQAQYAPGGGAPAQSAAFYSQVADRPEYSSQVNYQASPEYYQSMDQYGSGYANYQDSGSAYQSDMLVRALPVDRGWAYDNPVDGLFKHVVSHSWMRLEYLLWKAPPGNQVIGGDLPSGNDPRKPFTANDFFNFGTVSAREADLSSIGKQGSNGIRGTMGIDFVSGSIEASFFGMDSDYSSVSYSPADLMGSAFGQTDYISIIGTLDGEVAQVGRNFNNTFSVKYQTSAWGAESNYVINTEALIFRTYHGAGGLQIRPLVGFRYLKIGEEMDVRGGFEELTTDPPQPFFESTLNAQTSNKLYVPQAGIRMEFIHPWFTLSAEPKVGFGVNNYNGSVMTDEFLGPEDPSHFTYIGKTGFSPTFEFGLNARIHVSENITFNVGYNFLWANHIARPSTIVDYNYNSANLTDGVSLFAKDSLDSYKLHGLVLGGEIRFP